MSFCFIMTDTQNKSMVGAYGDPFRSFRWGNRPWRTVRHAFYHGGTRRPRPAGFPFQAVSIEADGARSKS